MMGPSKEVAAATDCTADRVGVTAHDAFLGHQGTF